MYFISVKILFLNFDGLIEQWEAKVTQAATLQYDLEGIMCIESICWLQPLLYTYALANVGGPDVSK